MSQGKIKFARRLGTLALGGLFIAALIVLNDSMTRMQVGPRHQMGALSIAFMVLGLLIGIIGTPIYFLLLLFGWVDPVKRPVYLRRTRRTAIWSGLTAIAAFATLALAGEDLGQFGGVLGIVAVLVMVVSGIAALIFYLAGWAEGQPAAPQRHALGIPRVGAGQATSTVPTRPDPPSQQTSFLGRLGGVFIGFAILAAVVTIPVALVAVAVAYSELPEADSGYIVLIGPLAFGYVLTIGVTIAAVSAVVGLIFKAIGRRR